MNNHKQRGIVLVVSLLLLLILTLIAITAANQSSLQLRISSNSQEQNAAFQAAESGLIKWTESYFQSTSYSMPNATFAPTMDLTAGPVTAVSSGSTRETFSILAISNPKTCSGQGMRPGSIELYCFEVQSTGQACDSDGNCTATAVHRQGGQRRGATSL